MLRSSMKGVLGVFIAGALLSFCVVALGEGGPAVGSAPPEVKAEGWINAKGSVSLAELKGKVVVVEFWATWCPPCRKSIPHLAEIHKAKAKDGLVIMGLTAEDKATVEPFMQKTEMPYIVGYGSSSGKDYGVRGIPSAFVVGADGKLVWSGHPMKDEFAKAIDDALAAAKK